MTPTIVWVTSETSCPTFVQFPGSSSMASSTMKPKISNWLLVAVLYMILSLAVADGSINLNASQQASSSCFGLPLNTINGCFASTTTQPQSTITSNAVVILSNTVSTETSPIASLNITGSPVLVGSSGFPGFSETLVVASALYSNWKSCTSNLFADASACLKLFMSYFTATEEPSNYTFSIPVTLTTHLPISLASASSVPTQAPPTSRFTIASSQPTVTSRTSTSSGTRMIIPRIFLFFALAVRLIATVSGQFISTQSGNETVVIVPQSLYSDWRSCITAHNMSTKDCPLQLTVSLTTRTVQPSTITFNVFVTPTQMSVAISSFASSLLASCTATPTLPPTTVLSSTPSSTPATAYSTVTSPTDVSPTAISPTPKRSSSNRARAMPSLLIFLVQFLKFIPVISANIITIYTDSAFYSQWQDCITAHHNITSDCPLGLAWSLTKETVTKSLGPSETVFVTTSIVESIVAMSFTTAEPAAPTITSIIFATSTIGVVKTYSETISSAALSTTPFILPVPTSSTKASSGTRARSSAMFRFVLIFLAAYLVPTVVADWMTVPLAGGIKSNTMTVSAHI